MTAVQIERSTDAVRAPFALLLGLAWLLAAIQLLAQGWAATAHTLPDADDAMRLVELREFLAGRGWFDLHEIRLAPPLGYDTHWSRLIDAALAGLYLLFRTSFDPALAERLTVALWPMLWLIPAFAGVAALAWRIAGHEAALIVLLLAVFAMPGFQQFRPGRIDHHNIHLTLSVLVVAAAAWSDRKPWCAWVAGALTGLAFAIGFESAPFVVVGGLAFAVRFFLDRTAAPALRGYGLAVAASTLTAFFISVPPARWTQSVCDALAFNSAAAAVLGAIGLALAASFRPERRWVRGAAIGAAGAAALLVFLVLQPRCLGGPFALVDPAIGPAWLDHVSEVQSLARVMRESTVTGLATLAFPGAGLLAAVLLAARPRHRHDIGTWIAGAAFLVAFAMTMIEVKVFSYAMWFGLPLVAAALLDLFARFQITSLAVRFAAALVLTPTAVTLGAMTLAQAGGSQPLILDTAERQACVRKDGAAALAQLPPGLIVTNELEWAPYLLAWTPHSAYAAPYHRLSRIIVTAHQMLARPPAAAHALISGAGIDYIVTCGGRGPLGLDDAELQASLWGRLAIGAVPDWLTRVPMPDDQPFTVYRVKS